ncbi:hypothetical protein AB0K09_15690 [Streptomyces sp. NPDC049577]|uniref:hypothetical protein n=1 Tax=Streptomyces sp. NPDC049577 TaxID=3155153 RepID=UPI003423E814
MSELLTPPAPHESLDERYDRLYAEYRRLLHVPWHDRTEADRERLLAVRRQLQAIRATPPDGYTLPAAAAGLIAHAHTHGWLADASWRDSSSGEPSVTVQVGRRLTPAEQEHYLGLHWLYRLAWHSRGCTPGGLRLFGQGTAQTPDHPAAHSAPSVRQIREVIAAHPAPSEAGHD